jgi:hypothetical protein
VGKSVENLERGSLLIADEFSAAVLGNLRYRCGDQCVREWCRVPACLETVKQSNNTILVGVIDVEKRRMLGFSHNINVLPTIKVFRRDLRRRSLKYKGPFDLNSLLRLLTSAILVDLVTEVKTEDAFRSEII